ncbi:acetate kinase [Aquaspirillum soli]
MSSVLVINCGSSSLKFVLLDPETGEVALKGLAERLGQPGAHVLFKGDEGYEFDLQQGAHSEAMQAVLAELDKRDLMTKVRAVGHRVVHGGERFQGAITIDDDVLTAIEACSTLAPLHNPANLIGIHAARQHLPHLPHVAVFDTAFHQTMPSHAYLYAVPMSLYKEHGVRRYGFHGTSHRYVCQRTAQWLRKPTDEICMISAHLGNGSSACAIVDGKSVDTTMGLTPLEGLVMGTRSGDIDPGILPFLCEVLKTDVQGVNELLNRKSGLLGLSELSNDCRELLEAEAQGHQGAHLALEVFVHRLAKAIAGLMTNLPRIDAVVFTGGIGENAPSLRARTLQRLGLFGYRVDAQANAVCVGGKEGQITAAGSPLALALGTDEERTIARDTLALC